MGNDRMQKKTGKERLRNDRGRRFQGRVSSSNGGARRNSCDKTNRGVIKLGTGRESPLFKSGAKKIRRGERVKGGQRGPGVGIGETMGTVGPIERKVELVMGQEGEINRGRRGT